MKKLLLSLILVLLITSCKQKSDISVQPLSSNTNVVDSLTTVLDSLAVNGPIVGFAVADDGGFCGAVHDALDVEGAEKRPCYIITL